MFLLGDHIVWLHRNNLVQMKDIKEWERFSNKSWLYSIILNLITDYRAIKAASSLPLASASSSSSGGRLNSDPESGNLFQKTVCNLLEKGQLLGLCRWGFKGIGTKLASFYRKNVFYSKTWIWKILYFLKSCPIFVGTTLCQPTIYQKILSGLFIYN